MALIRRSSILPVSAESAQALAAKIELFEFVVAPYLRIRDIDAPRTFEAGSRGSGRLWWFGVIPAWRHHIHLIRMGAGEIYTNEHGGPVRRWNHRLTFEPLDARSCRYTDEIEIDDGLHGLGTRVFARLMFVHRHRRWRALTRVLA